MTSLIFIRFLPVAATLTILFCPRVRRASRLGLLMLLLFIKNVPSRSVATSLILFIMKNVAAKITQKGLFIVKICQLT